MGLGPAKELPCASPRLLAAMRDPLQLTVTSFARAPAQDDNWLQSSTILPELPDFISSIPSLNSV